jgi:hypothetical protein
MLDRLPVAVEIDESGGEGCPAANINARPGERDRYPPTTRTIGVRMPPARHNIDAAAARMLPMTQAQKVRLCARVAAADLSRQNARVTKKSSPIMAVWNGKARLSSCVAEKISATMSEAAKMRHGRTSESGAVALLLRSKSMVAEPSWKSQMKGMSNSPRPRNKA